MFLLHPARLRLKCGHRITNRSIKDQPFYVVCPPEPIRDKLNSEITKILDEPDIRAQFVKLGIQPSRMSMADMARFIEEERLGWKALIDSEKITVD